MRLLASITILNECGREDELTSLPHCTRGCQQRLKIYATHNTTPHLHVKRMLLAQRVRHEWFHIEMQRRRWPIGSDVHLAQYGLLEWPVKSAQVHIIINLPHCCLHLWKLYLSQVKVPLDHSDFIRFTLIEYDSPVCIPIDPFSNHREDAKKCSINESSPMILF